MKTGRAVEELTQPRFIGEVVTRWLKHDGDDRLMELEKRFAFTDSHGNIWVAPQGFIFDGTTIPRALWTLFGDPYIGDYRRAAVIHDLLCTPRCGRCRRLTIDHGKHGELVCAGECVRCQQIKEASDQTREAIKEDAPRYACSVHGGTRVVFRVSSDEAAEVMFEAMRADGVSETRARIISRTVAQWGPRFARSESKPSAATAAPMPQAA